jgi:small subunit ribosomal protein S2
MLTNFATTKKSLHRLKKIEKMEVDGTFEQLTKKEIARLLKEKGKLEKSLGGVKDMSELPGAIFIIDTRKEAIAVAEAQRLKIPIVAVVDTNCNPENIDYPIPGNDDAIRAISLFTKLISDAVLEADNEVGLEVIETLQDDDVPSYSSKSSSAKKDEDEDEDEDDEEEEEEEEAPAPKKKKATPVDAAPVETAPVETTPVEAAPVDTAPVDTAPVDTDVEENKKEAVE